YDIEITKISEENSEDKNLVIKITDDDLLSKTGGIVQGMSGSPVIQDGKLVGAVTHVFINDPTQGYAIFSRTMLQKMRSADESIKKAS
ncbi:MAG: SpoIVB peptidase, partial [Clostridia bacterium]|nr:SpoIVB peptidase [Clostridia bacterium]